MARGKSGSVLGDHWSQDNFHNMTIKVYILNLFSVSNLVGFFIILFSFLFSRFIFPGSPDIKNTPIDACQFYSIADMLVVHTKKFLVVPSFAKIVILAFVFVIRR